MTINLYDKNVLIDINETIVDKFKYVGSYWFDNLHKIINNILTLLYLKVLFKFFSYLICDLSVEKSSLTQLPTHVVSKKSYKSWQLSIN